MSSLSNHEIPGRVTTFAGKGGLAAIRVESDFGTAEIYQHGAHVTCYCRKGETPILFLSESSDFLPDKPIRGGVPVIFPWFGAREGHAFHGFARLTDWDLTESLALPDGSIRLTFLLPGSSELRVEYVVTVGASLLLELHATNLSAEAVSIETCLHTYFRIGDIHQVEVAGLKGAVYRDQLLAADIEEEGESIRFSAETDRIYQQTEAAVEIIDLSLKRIIHVRKSGSMSTVVWNPWIEKSKRMVDFGDDEYLQMVCVESGNVRECAIRLEPGERTTLRVEIESSPLK